MKKIILFILLGSLLSCSPQDSFPDLNIDSSSKTLELFGEGLITTGLQERDIAISPDRNMIIYTLGSHDQSRRCLIAIKKEADKWGKPTLLPFTGKFDDIEPFFSLDGKQLFFASDRPLPGDSDPGDYNIWSLPIDNEQWGAPQALDTIINTSGDEFYPSVGNSGNLYFTATRSDGIGREDIFISRYNNGQYLKPEVLDTAINSTFFEFNAYVNPDETLLVFSSFGRPDGLGGGDLYFSKKDNKGEWLPAVNMGQPINSDRLDFCPFIDYNVGNFYFTSNRKDTSKHSFQNISQFIDQIEAPLNGSGNIYRMSIEDLFE